MRNPLLSLVIASRCRQRASRKQARRIDEDEEYNPDVVLDEESILTECVQAQVPRQWLSWHYRSQDESLIAFSNYHYYDGRLASFPAPLAVNAPAVIGHGISLVAGQRSLSSAAVRERLFAPIALRPSASLTTSRQRFWASPDDSPSLGVITFNAQQRDLIENLLRDAGDDRILQALDEPDGLFVKNLENVQGDERDTILFSVAFSANDKGVVPLNFGPLSRPGGERRLNVAVTRARREVVLYCELRSVRAARGRDHSSRDRSTSRPISRWRLGVWRA